MKSIQVTRRFVRHEWGGVETAVLETARHLLQIGQETHIATSAALSRPGAEELRGVNIARFKHFYPFFGLTSEARMAMDMKGGNLVSFPLLRHLKTTPGLDLLHTHTLNRLGGIVRHVARQRRIPYVVSIHGGVHDIPAQQLALLGEPGSEAFEWGRALGWWFGSHHVLDDAALIICYGESEHRLATQHHPNARVELLPHGVDIQRFSTGDRQGFRRQHQIPDSAPVLLTMARIDPQKDQLLAVQGLHQLLQSDPQTHLVLMGPVTDANYHAQIIDAIRQHGVEERVRLLPGVTADDPQLVDAFHAADVLLLPSMHEVFGIVILEAWAANLPVVASNVGGIGSLVHDQQDGLLFEQRDLASMVRCCSRVLQDRRFADHITKAAMQRIHQHFGWDTISKRVANLYEEVCYEHVA